MYGRGAVHKMRGHKMATILLKRGQATKVNNITLAEGEVAVAYNTAKDSAQLYVGGANGKPVLITADVAAAVSAALTQANSYTDSEISKKATDINANTAAITKLNGADTVTGSVAKTVKDAINKFATEVTSDGTINTFKEVLDYISQHGSDYTSLVGKVTNNEVNIGTIQSDVSGLKTTVAGKVDKVSGKDLSEANFTSAEKTKLSGIAANANYYTHPSSHAATMITEDSTHRFVTDTEKSTWNAKLGAGDTIDGGTF